MIRKLLLFSFVLFASLSVHANNLDAKIDFGNFENALVKQYVLERIAEIRDTAKLTALTPNEKLDEACDQHASFLEKNKKVVHYQDKKKYKDPRTRAQTAGANFPVVYEDMAVVLIGRPMYLANSSKKVTISTYRELGDYIVNLWINSSYNRKHLLTKTGKAVGFSVLSNPKTKKVYVVMNIGR